MRSLLEKLSRNRSFKKRLSVNGVKSKIFVSPDAQLQFIKPGNFGFDSGLIKIAEKHLSNESIVWDIGSNVGVFAFAAATISRQGTVYAIEPDLFLANLIRKTIEHSTGFYSNVKLLSAAVSNQTGLAELLIAERGRASNSLDKIGGTTQFSGTRNKQFTCTVTLDSLLQSLRLPTFIKIDIEGADLLAIQGASEILKRVRPVFYVEVTSSVAEEIYNIFEQASYLAIDPENDKVIEKCCYNTIFIPRESY